MSERDAARPGLPVMACAFAAVGEYLEIVVPGHAAREGKWEGYRELEPMLERVLKHKGFFESWTRDSHPKGAREFRGSAGVLLEATGALREWAKGEHDAG